MRLAGLAVIAAAVGIVPATGRAVLAPPPGNVDDPVNGYPFSYTDFTGLSLGQCEDPVHCPAGTGLLGNEPDFEAFYWMLTDPGTLPNNGLYEMALEAATFANLANPPDFIDRTVFYRFRFRMDALVPGADYTISHPFGESTYPAAADGTIDVTVDLGGVSQDPTSVLPVFGSLLCDPPTTQCTTPAPGFPNGGQFVTWDATPPAAPPGFAGSFATPHEITPGPSGRTNLVIQGPGVNVTVTQFLVAAQIAGDVPPRIINADKAAPLSASRISGAVTKVLDWLDPNGPSTITPTLTGLPDFCTQDLPAGPPFPNQVTITCTPVTTTAQASTPVKLTVTDDLDAAMVDSVSFSILVDNLAPVVSQIPATFVANDSTDRVVLPVTASDPDGNGIANITATLTPAPSAGSSWFSFTRTGQNTGEIVIQGPIPVADGNRTYAIDIHVTDTGTPTRLTEVSASLQVNNAPTVIVQGGGGGCSTGGGAGLLGLVLVPLLLRGRRTE